MFSTGASLNGPIPLPHMSEMRQIKNKKDRK